MALPPRPNRRLPDVVEIDATTAPHTAPPPPMPAQRSKLDSMEVSAASLLDELKSETDKRRALAAKAAELEAKLAARVESVAPVASDKALGHAVRVILAQLGRAFFAAALGAGSVILARPSADPGKVEAQEVRLKTVQTTAGANEDRQVATERYNRLLAAALSCRLRHVRGALEREGMTLDSLPSGAIDWRSRYMPGRAVHTTPEWRLSDDCPEMPEPP